MLDFCPATIHSKQDRNATVGAISKAEKAQIFQNMLKLTETFSHAWKTLQKFGYSALGQMGALVFEPPPPR